MPKSIALQIHGWFQLAVLVCKTGFTGSGDSTNANAQLKVCRPL